MDRKRLRIAVLFNFRKGWMGGIIYIINLINALNSLDEEDKPEIILLYTPALAEFIPQIRYPYLQAVEWNFYGFYKGYLLSWLRQRNVFIDSICRKYRPDGIYPLNDWPVSGKQYLESGTRIVAWIPDLQHKFYPNFFGRMRVFLRELRIKLLLRNTSDLAVSSRDVEGQFRKFYGLNGSPDIHVLQFVSIAENVSTEGVQELLARYKVPDKYFMVSNQFTNHKNHPIILKALKLLNERRAGVHFVFTGKMEFKGNEKYIGDIRNMIRAYNLEDQVHLLGVIPRRDQLLLMKNARAIVQPSLFEGWSTVIEDAKTLNVPVIASDLPVNMEQLGDTGYFFDRHDERALASLLASFEGTRPTGYKRYEDRVRTFAEGFVGMFK